MTASNTTWKVSPVQHVLKMLHLILAICQIDYHVADNSNITDDNCYQAPFKYQSGKALNEHSWIYNACNSFLTRKNWFGWILNKAYQPFNKYFNIMMFFVVFKLTIDLEICRDLQDMYKTLFC